MAVAKMPPCRLQRYWILVLFLGPYIVASGLPSSRLGRQIQVAVDPETVFVEECTSFLLSDDTLDDGLISQDEFANFLSGYCVLLGVCSTDTDLEFQNLSVELQLSFLLFICDQPQDLEREECLDSLVSEGGEFGYDLSMDEFAVLEMEVEQLCSQSFQYASLSGLLPPTVAPTSAPSVVTVSPTPFPTPNDGSLGSPSPTNGLQPGGATDGENDDPLVSTSSGLSTPAITGVSVAAAVVVVAFALLFHRRRGRAVDNEKDVVDYEVAGDESIFTEDSAQFKLGLPQSLQGSTRSGGSISGSISGSSAKGSSGSDYTPKNSMLGTVNTRSVAQFDPSNAAAAIALGRGGGMVLSITSSRGNSVHSMDSDTKEAKIRDLDEAINCGDWDKVGRIAGSLASSSEEVSSWSEISSNAGRTTSVRSSMSSLRSEEARLSAQIDELVRRGDWSGVAAAVENFSSTSDRNFANQCVADASGEQPRRSFLDFVTGRRILSSAADAAILPASQDRNEINASQHSVVGEATPAIFELGNRQSGTIETESLSSHGSKKDKHGNRKSTRSFLGRFWSGRTASEVSFDPSSQPVAAAASLPRPPSDDSEEGGKKPAAKSSIEVLRAKLDEALARGDWGAIEAIAAEIDASSTDTPKQKGGMSRSAVIKQFVSKGRGADNEWAASLSLSKKSREASSPSRRVELDNAVERGDWESVERLSTELLNSNPASHRDDSFKILSDDDKLTDTLLMDSTALSPIGSSSFKSPFWETPSSSEWSHSPIDKEKTDAIRKLINAQDWQGVQVLSGIFEMEKKGTLPPTFASMSADSAENPTFERKWLRPGPTGTPPDMEHQVAPARPPPSPATSSSTEVSVDLKEFQRLVNEKDWRGLASFAGAEQEEDFDNEVLFARNLFGSGSENEQFEVELRQTRGPTPKIEHSESDKESIHGAELLIPFWEQVISQHSPDASKEDASKMSNPKGKK